MAIHELLIAPSGKVERLWTVKVPCAAMDQAVVKALRQWEYDPTVVDGKAMPVCMTVATRVDVR